jgi:hypothetical protein
VEEDAGARQVVGLVQVQQGQRRRVILRTGDIVREALLEMEGKDLILVFSGRFYHAVVEDLGKGVIDAVPKVCTGLGVLDAEREGV